MRSRSSPPGAMALLLEAAWLVPLTPAPAPLPAMPPSRPWLQEDLPLPMTPGNYQRKSSTCLLQLAFEKVVVANEGFEW